MFFLRTEDVQNLLLFFTDFMSVWWDVKWCPISRITTPLARKRLFNWISMKSRLVRAVRETSNFQNWSLLTNSRRYYMAEILPIRHKTLLINKSLRKKEVFKHLLPLKPIWLKSDLYLRYHIEDLITPHYSLCSVLIILTNPSLLLCYWK